MAGNRRDRPSWVRYYSLGFEFAAAFAVFTFLGYLVDRHYDCGPVGVLIGAVLGLIGGGYNFIREAMAAFKPPAPPDRDQDEGPPQQP
jgi:F0F1-type ATP synthase assembly protein I